MKLVLAAALVLVLIFCDSRPSSAMAASSISTECVDANDLTADMTVVTEDMRKARPFNNININCTADQILIEVLYTDQYHLPILVTDYVIPGFGYSPLAILLFMVISSPLLAFAAAFIQISRGPTWGRKH